MVSFQLIVEEAIIVLAMALMVYAILQINNLLTILEGSKVESVWKQTRLLVILLLLLFFFFGVVRLLATIDKSSESFTMNPFLFNLGIGTTHNLMMNSSFLLTSLLLLLIIRVDNKAYNALFELIQT